MIGDPRRKALWLLALTAAALPILTIRRVPTPFADVQLYASIARARQLYGVGVPTITWNSPSAVDHIPFYGPVFFDLSALALRLFGVGILSFRLVSLIGTSLYVLGVVLLARQFSASRNGALFAAALVLLSPEVNFGVGTGAMHMLAVGFEMLALAVFVRHFDRRRGGARYGAAAGLCLAMAALTTTRSYPFVAAFVVAGLVPSIFGTGRLAIRFRLLATLIVLTSAMLFWAWWSHGSVSAWVRYLTFIFTHEDTDVAILPTAVRDFSFHWSGVQTLAASVVGGLAAAASLMRPAVGRDEARHAALSFLLLCAWVELVTTTVTLNYTFTIGEYIALPLFGVVVSWPREWRVVPRAVVAAGVAALLAADLGVLAYRYSAIFLTWDARNPDALNAFVDSIRAAGIRRRRTGSAVLLSRGAERLALPDHVAAELGRLGALGAAHRAGGHARRPPLSADRASRAVRDLGQGRCAA